MAERLFGPEDAKDLPFVGVDPEYRTYSSTTDAPVIADGEAGKLQMEAAKRERGGKAPAKGPGKARSPRRAASKKAEPEQDPEQEKAEPEQEKAGDSK